MAHVLQRQSRLREQVADGVQGEEAQMAAIQNAALAILPAAAQQAAQYIEVLHIGDAGHDHALIRQHVGRLAQHAPWIDQVFQHVGEDDGVERRRRKREPIRLDICRFDPIEPAPRARSAISGTNSMPVT